LAALFVLAAAAGPARAQQRVPVIFLHGIGGSMLAEKSNPEKIYFGNVKETMDRFAKLELPLDRTKNLLDSVDVMRTAQLARGSSVDQYIIVIRRLEALGYKEDRDLFMFHYDWRRSNFASADKLRKFIADKGLASKPVDLIGHSMGGLVSTIYIQKYAGEQKVRNFIAMGTPSSARSRRSARWPRVSPYSAWKTSWSWRRATRGRSIACSRRWNRSSSCCPPTAIAAT
jgi:pimeloyl-ACP methyl ester carboxylesterase